MSTAATDKKAVGEKKSSMAAAGAEIISSAPKLKIPQKDERAKQVFQSAVTTFSHNAFITSGPTLNMALDPDDSSDGESSSESTRGMSPRSKKQARAKKRKAAAMGQAIEGRRRIPEGAETNNIYAEDPNQLDLIKGISSMELLNIAEKFDQYPGEELDLQQFVYIMKKVIGDCEMSRREDFIQQLVDLFYRSNKINAPTIKFADLTSYLIEHEIKNYTEDATQMDMLYQEQKDLRDRTPHNGQIEKIYYFEKIDKVILFEANMKVVRIYDAVKMKPEPSIMCSHVINAIEFITERNAIAISLSDLTIRFYEVLNGQNRFLRTLHVPSTQKCLSYVKRKKKELLFSGGTQGAVFAWNIEDFFSKDYKSQPGDPDYVPNQDGSSLQPGQNKEEKSHDDLKKEYIKYRAEYTPWFVYDFIQCLQYLPNINQLAVGVYDGKILLYDLRQKQAEHGDGNGAVSGEAGAKEKKQMWRKQVENHFGDHLQFANDDIYSENTVRPIKTLEGHKRAVREMAYSEKHKVIVSCGFDFEVCVWNPYLTYAIIRLDGHEHPLIGVNCLPNLDCFITADLKGMVKVWNILDYSCIQTFYVPNANEVKCIRAVPKHRRLICGARVFTVFQYQRPFIPDYTDDKTVCRALFSEKRLEIFVAGERNIKVWDARTGKPIRVIKNVFDVDITQMVFDEDHRKLVVGSHMGDLRIYDLQSGVLLLELEGHNPMDGLISFVGYGGGDHTIISCGWDKTIKVHMDEMVNSNTAADLVKRGKPDCHKREIVCGAYAHNLGLIATGSQDCRVKVWDYERVILLDEFPHKYEIQIVHFIKPFPLLLTSDSVGTLRIWIVRPPPPCKPHEYHARLVTKLDNMSIEKEVTVTAIDTHYNEETGELLLLQGDENGEIVVYDISNVPKMIPDFEKIDIIGNDKMKRNPHREFPIEHEERKRQGKNSAAMDSDSDIDEHKLPDEKNMLVPESEVKTIVKKTRKHSDLIKSIQYVGCTDRPMILTGSTDRLVHLIDLKTSQIVGTLKQGYKTMPNYQWNFPIERHLMKHPDRATEMERKLMEVREKRDIGFSSKKKKEIELINAGKMTSYGFTGAQLTGMGGATASAYNTAQAGIPGATGSPSKFGATNSSVGGYGTNKFGGAQAYATNTSQFSMFTEKELRVKDIISRGKMVAMKEARRQIKNDEKEKKKATKEHKSQVNKIELQEKKIEEEAIQAYQERQAKLQRIGSFKFDIDNDLDVEILTKDQVFEDLDDIVKIREKTGDPEGNNSAYKSVVMNIHTRGNKKKKRR